MAAVEPKEPLTAEQVAQTPEFEKFLETIGGELVKPANPDVLGLMLLTQSERLFVSEGDWVVRFSRHEIAVWDNVTFQRRLRKSDAG
jgi:hypothetical protein